jgi:hypothetical protein
MNGHEKSDVTFRQIGGKVRQCLKKHSTVFSFGGRADVRATKSPVSEILSIILEITEAECQVWVCFQ